MVLSGRGRFLSLENPWVSPFCSCTPPGKKGQEARESKMSKEGKPGKVFLFICFVGWFISVEFSVYWAADYYRMRHVGGSRARRVCWIHSC